MWVSGCVTALATWMSGPSALASRGHGAVDVVGPVAPPGRASGRGGAKECTQIGENGLSAPFWTICVHCYAVVGRRGDAGVYTDRRKWPLGAVLGHLCTLLRRELRRVTRAPQPPWCAGSAPSVARLSLGRENRLCASDAAARLAFSPGRQPTQTPEEPDVPGTSLAHNWQPDGVRAPDPGGPVYLAHPPRGLGGDEPPALAQNMSPLNLRREPGGNASPNETASAVPAAQALCPLDSTAHLWYKGGGYCRTGGGLPSAGDVFPGFFHSGSCV